MLPLSLSGSHIKEKLLQDCNKRVFAAAHQSVPELAKFDSLSSLCDFLEACQKDRCRDRIRLNALYAALVLQYQRHREPLWVMLLIHAMTPMLLGVLKIFRSSQRDLSQREREQEVVMAFLAAARTITPQPERTFVQLWVGTNGPVRNCGRARKRERQRFDQLDEELTPEPGPVWAGRCHVHDVPLGLPIERRADAARLLQKQIGERAPAELIDLLVDIRVEESFLLPYLRDRYAGLSVPKLRMLCRVVSQAIKSLLDEASDKLELRHFDRAWRQAPERDIRAFEWVRAVETLATVREELDMEGEQNGTAKKPRQIQTLAQKQQDFATAVA